jgi:hypothetical protein
VGNLTQDERKQIRAAARALFERYRKFGESACQGFVDPSSGLPVRTDLIISDVLHLPIRRIEEIPNERQGETAGWYDKDVVLIADRQSPSRRRYTEAHEIGHIILHPGITSSREHAPGMRKSHKERQADFFAAQLLMPEELVRELFLERFGKAISRFSIEENFAFALYGTKVTATVLRQKPIRELAGLLAEARWFDGCGFDPLVDVFGVSVGAMSWQIEDLRLLA